MQRIFHRHFALIRTTLIISGCVVLASGGLFFTYQRVHAAGTAYYVAPSGNDANNGTSTSSPFLTIQKCATVAQAGDTCFMRGGTYRETVTPTNSGTSSAPITFAAYNGERVTVSGADVVTGWSLTSGSVYHAGVTLPVSGFADTGFLANQIFVDGQMMNEARWPNTSFDLMHPTEATAGSGSSCGSSSSTIYDSAIPSTNLAGAVIHVRGGYDWTAQTGTVSSSSAGQLSFTGGNYDCGDLGVKSGSKFYVTGLASLLDTGGEWSYDGSTHHLSLWSPNGDAPANHSVEAKQRNTAFDLSGRTYVAVVGISIFAANVKTNSSSTYDVLDGLNVRYVSHFVTLPANNSYLAGCDIYCTHADDSGIILAGNHNTLQDSTITWSAGSGVSLQGTNNTVTNSLITNTDYAATYNATIELIGTSATISHNTLSNTGRDGINGGSSNEIITYNDVANYGQLNQDTGGFYTCCNAINGAGTTLDHNWFHDNQATSDRGFSGAYTGAGIYIDNGANGFLIHHNLAWNNAGDGIRNNGFTSGMSKNNLLYNNTLAGGQADSLAIAGASDCAGSRYINNIFRGSASTCTNATSANNLGSGTDPVFANTAINDFHLQSTSPAINAGQAITTITDGSVGTAPDEGAYESGGLDWVPGCSFAGCHTYAFSVDDSVQGTGTNQFNYTGSGWTHSTGTTGQGYYGNSVSYDSTTNDHVSFTFNGTHATLYGCQWGGIAGITLDTNPEVLVDFFAPSQLNNVALWSTPLMSAGSHTLTIRVTGTKNASSSFTYIPIDRVQVDQIAANTTTLDDGNASLVYRGSGWSHATGITGQGYYNNTVSYDGTANDDATITFTGVAITLHASQWGGIMGVRLDDGTEQLIDLYAPGQGNDVVVWSSPLLYPGDHTLTIRATGTKNSSSSYAAIPLDRVDVASLSPTSIDDQVVGSGTNQFSYSGSGWAACTACSQLANHLYSDTNSWDTTTNDTATIAFTGRQILLYSVISSGSGIVALSIDNGTETAVDLSGESRIEDVPIWVSPLLTSGSHTLKIRVTGLKGIDASNVYGIVDRVDISS